MQTVSKCKGLIVGLGNPGVQYTDTRHNLGFRALDRLRENLAARDSIAYTIESLDLKPFKKQFPRQSRILRASLCWKISGWQTASSKCNRDSSETASPAESDYWLLLQPGDYMNRSGLATIALMEIFGLLSTDLLVAYDDLDLPCGSLRLRKKGRSGGHRGLESLNHQIAEYLRSQYSVANTEVEQQQARQVDVEAQQYGRLRLGIGHPRDAVDRAEVLKVSDYVLQNFAAHEQQRIEDLLQKTAEAAICWITEGMDNAMNQFNRA